MREYGLIGFPLSHSFSQKYFTKKFSEEAVPAVYNLYEMPNIKELPALLRSRPKLYGLSVTIPHKESVIPFLDELSDEAREVGAVNCISVMRKGNDVFTKGYNTDVYGFLESLRAVERLFSDSLILGTGGAAKAVAKALEKENISYTFVSRKRDVASGEINYSDIKPKMLQDFDLIINCTPLGTFPNIGTYPPIPYSALTKKHFAFDLVYNPSETEFLKRAAAYETPGKNGLEMLYKQADQARAIFNNDFMFFPD